MLNPNAGKSIFVQIASFRDSQLLPTLRDMIDKATEPENLKICICHQHHVDDEWDNLDEYKDDDRFIIIDVDAKESKGVCWARNLIQQEYDGEDFTLQLDSHHRFVEDWDVELKNEILQLQLQGYDKPLLTGYISSFHPSLPKDKWAKEPWQMNFDRFTPDGVVFFSPGSIPNFEDLKTPIPARFYSAHFCFTLGVFCEEVQHDPEYYFHGEEITIGVRAYTKGYDIFHPHKIVAYHEFSRDYRPDKHWDTYSNWGNHNEHTFKCMRELLGIDGEGKEKDRYGKYGLGKERTVQDWEEYAGVQFATRKVKRETLDNCLPGTGDSKWCNVYKHFVDIDMSNFSEDDYTFCALALHDKDGNTIFRRDADAAEIKEWQKKDIQPILFNEVIDDIIPHEWVVWPHSESKGFGERLSGLTGR